MERIGPRLTEVKATQQGFFPSLYINPAREAALHNKQIIISVFIINSQQLWPGWTCFFTLIQATWHRDAAICIHKYFKGRQSLKTGLRL
ncbi:hypothetical protein [Arachidicoccus rhizosphaerae]|jgi:hypothetical protein|uniref:hypothetical protein n=1 Tax=Arachidicoccus rhizosphaerae TaxID=551991 RepID=UPI00147BEF38|nr:hypothetical protein [Arachidicoccus rhizosphaerae]